MRRRIHITGASGSGTTTLGAALAERLTVPHFDTDDFYWYPSRPEFERKRPVKERIRLLRAALLGAPGWVLSGSLNPWGNELASEFDQVVSLYVPPEQRLRRSLERERKRYGHTIDPSGSNYAKHIAFMNWSSRYDVVNTKGRSLTGHRAWLATLPSKVVEIYGTPTLEQSVEAVLSATCWRSRLEFPPRSADGRA